MYRVLGKEGEETQCPTSQTPVTMILKGDFISGQNFQKEMTMTLTPAGVVPGLGAILLNNTIGERVEAIIQLTWDMAIMITEGFLLVQP